MTLGVGLFCDDSFESDSDLGSALIVAREVLRQVRYPEAIYLQDISLNANVGCGVGTFSCPRSMQFPNPDLAELTGGQLIDVATQMAYCLTGLMIHGGVDLLGLDFERFKREIHAHRVHAVRTDMTFRRPCLFDRPFSVSARLHRYRDGRFCVSRRNPRRYFVRIDLQGSQGSGDEEGTSSDIFHAHIAACHEPS